VSPIGAWYAGNGDPGWAPRRARVVAVLAEADRLASLAELIGVTALPAHERMTLVGGRLLREAVLQQSSLSDVDSFSAPERTAALTDAVLGIIDRAQELVAAGVAPQAVEEVDVAPLVRAREAPGVDEGAAAVRAALEALV
jgi:V/A-type H+-transporting ATPase subunit A